MQNSIITRRARLDEIIDLRHGVLRAGFGREAAIFPGDELASSRHYAAFLSDAASSKIDAAVAAIGCATLHLSEWIGERAWQLRGMATAPDFREMGVGRALIEAIEGDLAADADRRLEGDARGGAAAQLSRWLWCNAREPAIGFYERVGWTVQSEVFEIPTAGPHVKMSRRLGSD